MERRLAAILAADVVGYSRLMERDETGTLATLKSRRTEILQPMVSKHRGRIVKLMGDGVLVEFASAVNAVACAVELQAAMDSANAGAAEGQRIILRIGINLGDVMVEGSDLYGDGVNIAARLEALAEPGHVFVSQTIFSYVKGKIKLDFEDLGEQTLKNMTEPVRVYRVSGGAAASTVSPTPRSPKPSIVVLPFTNMSGDPEQEYFADGITEDLITELSKFHSLLVISRNSAFAFKGQPTNLKMVSAKLGVRYIVEGSVRRAGSRLRITAQLIDAMDDSHLWAERYDRQLEDIFDVQDEVVRAIISAIEPQLLSSERNRALRKPPESLDAWENYQRGLWHVFRYKPEERDLALSLFERAIELDPHFASAHAGLGTALYVYILLGSSPDPAADLERSYSTASRAVMLDENDPLAHAALCRIYLLQGKPEMATVAADKAILLNPNFAMAHFGRGHSLWHAGHAAEAIACFDTAMRLSPNDPLMWAYMASKAVALALNGELSEAITWSRRAQQQPNAAIFAHVGEICALGVMNRRAEAREAIERARKSMPDVSIQHLAQVLPITHLSTREIFLKGLRQAGLPE